MSSFFSLESAQLQHASVQHKIDKTLNCFTHKARTLDLADFSYPFSTFVCLSRFHSCQLLKVKMREILSF